MERKKNTSIKLTGVNSFVSIKGINYQVHTVLVPNKSPLIITNAFINETVVQTIKSSIPANRKIPVSIAKKQMKQQHDYMIHKLRLKHASKNMAKSEYLRKIRRWISSGKLKDALSLNEDALAVYPDNPFFMAYFGYLQAAVQNKLTEGIDMCKSAMTIYESQMKKEDERYLSYFYLNMGRIYLLCGKKDFAINSFRKGLKINPGDKETIIEIAKFGIRKTPPFSFLERNHPVNKYLGLFLTRARMR